MPDAAEYSATLNLPRTEFPMKADLPRREPLMQEEWARRNLVGRIRDARLGAPKFILHDGPPYVNGNVHMGHVLNKALKDFVVRFHTMCGMDAPLVPGWDTHGLPVELQAIKRFKLDRGRTQPVELRERCREFALSFLDAMTGQFARLGVLADWSHPYITLDPAYEAAEILAFGRMAERGLIYRGLRPVYWCADCGTALAEAEIEFGTAESPAITVQFPVRDGRGRLPEGTSALIWTTTPWTLPANVAIAVHPDLVYVVLDSPRGPVLVAEGTAAGVWAGPFPDQAPGPVLCRLLGSELEGVVCAHPFLDRSAPIVLADYVTGDEGTGLVHTAPGHGRDDFETGQRYDLPVIQSLDDHGRFGPEAGDLAGLFYERGGAEVVRILNSTGMLWHSHPVRHEVAHCWRCKTPVVWRATEQWFARVSAFRDEAIVAAEGVRWIPEWGRGRMAEMVSGRQDWCLSRQRVWGVPIPVLHCGDCGTSLLVKEVFERIAAIVRSEGADAWWRRPAEDFLPPGGACPRCGGRRVRKDGDILDVWFDSGCSHLAVLAPDPRLQWPADLYLEGPDQFRGWFQTSLLTAVAATGQAPYRAVLTNGWVLDGQGRAMHKSLGNVIEPSEMLGRWGADVLRLWVASVDYTSDVRISKEMMTQVGEVYRKIRNTIRYLLGNLSDFDPEADAPAMIPERDRYLLHRLAQTVERAGAAYREYRFGAVFRLIHDLCLQDLSSFYLDVAKDRLYCARADDPDRRGAQAAMYEALRVLLLLSAPILPHTAEEGWQAMRHRKADPDSVHLALWPEVAPGWTDEAVGRRWAALLRLRAEAQAAVERAVARGEIGQASEAVLTATGPVEEMALLGSLDAELADQLLVAAVQMAPGPSDGWRVTVGTTADPRCPRCWRHRPATDDRGLCARCAAVVPNERG